ncbi:MAG: hypothetical protein ACLFOY_12110 [Desulfatibacillaceae bacterium]
MLLVLSAGQAVPSGKAGPDDSSKYPYLLSVADWKREGGELVVEIDLRLEPGARGVPEGDATLGVLVQPHFVASMGTDIMSMGRDYTLREAGGLKIMASTVSLQDTDGATFRGAFLVVFGGPLGKPGSHTIRIPMDLTFGTGSLSMALYEQADMRGDQLTSVRYRQMSNVINQPL